VNDLTIGLLSALLATNQPQAVSNVIQQQTGVAVDVAVSPEQRELREVMMADDDAQAEVNGWLHDFDSLSATNKVAQSAALNRRIVARFDQVRQRYQTFLRNHPDSAEGYLAYGSFLNDIGDEDSAKTQYENSKQLDPKNPAVWNNLANYYGENGGLSNAFAYYAEAIRLKPDEPVYYQNLATTVYLFRKDAMAYYHLTEPEVFDKALDLYRQAMKCAPGDFVLATDYAESYYGIRPLRVHDALAAWTNAMTIAHNDLERQSVEIHLARVKTAAGLFAEAQGHLATVTNAALLDLKRRLERSLAEHEQAATNSTATVATSQVAAATNLVSVTNHEASAIEPLSTATNVPPGALEATNLLVLPPPAQLPALH
jgi:tetratricopeptide (TPR) repeat protein